MRAAAAKTATRPRSRRADRPLDLRLALTPPLLLLQLPVAPIDARLQVRAFRSPDREVRRRGPGFDLVESRTPQEEARVAIGASPIRPDAGQSLVLSEILSCVVDPGAEPSPRAEQRLVSDLDGWLSGGGFPIERQEPMPSEGVGHGIDRAGSTAISSSSLLAIRRRVSERPSPRVTNLRKTCLMARRPCCSVSS